MRTTDRRFAVAAKLHKAGCLNDLDDLFDIIPPTVVARRLGFKYDRIKELQQKPLTVAPCRFVRTRSTSGYGSCCDCNPRS